MHDIRLRILGSFEASLPTGVINALPTRKSEAILSYLGLRADRAYTRLAIADIFWSEVDYRRAKHSLRQTILLIKKSFPKLTPPLVIDSRTVAINQKVMEIDAIEFSRLAAEKSPDSWKKAVMYYRGDLLEGVDIREANIEEWLSGERACLREKYLGVLRKLLGWYIETKQWDLAIQCGLRSISRDPLQEDIHRYLICIYLQQNRTGRALQHYLDCVRILQNTLGVDPEKATQDLYRAILFSRSSQTRNTLAERHLGAKQYHSFEHHRQDD